MRHSGIFNQTFICFWVFFVCATAPVISTEKYNSRDFENIYINFQFSPSDSIQFKQHSNFISKHIITKLTKELIKFRINTILSISVAEDEEPTLSPGNLSRIDQMRLFIKWPITPDKFYPTMTFKRPADYFDSNLSDSKLLFLKDITIPEFDTANSDLFTSFLVVAILNACQQYDQSLIYLLNKKKSSIGSSDNFSFLFNYYIADGLLRTLGSKMIEMQTTLVDSAIFKLQSCLKDSSQFPNHRTTSLVFNNLAIAYQLSGQIIEAETQFRKALQQEFKTEDRTLLASIYTNLGNLLLGTENWHKARNSFTAFAEILKDRNEKNLLAHVYETIGNIHFIVSDFDDAIDYYEKSADLWQGLDEPTLLANQYSNLGDVYCDKKQYDRAFEYYQKNLELHIQLQDIARTAESYLKIGDVFKREMNVDSAKTYFHKAVKISSDLEQSPVAVFSLNALAKLHAETGYFEEAIDIYNQSLLKVQHLNAKQLEAETYELLGNIYNEKQDQDSAYSYFERAADIYTRTKAFENASLILFSMGLIRLKQEKHAAAYELIKWAVDLDAEYGYGNLQAERNFLKQIKNMMSQN